MSARCLIANTGMKKLRVLVDMDQTLADFEGHFLKRFREKYPDEPSVPLEERNTFYISDQYERIKEGSKRKVKSIYIEEGFFKDLPELPGACDAVKEMSNMDRVEVFLCTSPLFQYQYSTKEKYQWVEEHLGPDFINQVILTRDKTMIKGDLLIDDRADIKGSFQPEEISWEHILFTACHNKHMKHLKQERLENWTDGSWLKLINDRLKRF